MLPVYARDQDGLYNWGPEAGKQQVYLLWNKRGSTINDHRHWDMIWPDSKSFDPRKSRLQKLIIQRLWTSRGLWCIEMIMFENLGYVSIMKLITVKPLGF